MSSSEVNSKGYWSLSNQSKHPLTPFTVLVYTYIQIIQGYDESNDERVKDTVLLHIWNVQTTKNCGVFPKVGTKLLI